MNRDAVLAALELDEGFSERPYRDTRRLWTVGVGFCLEKTPFTGAEYAYLLDNGHLTLSIDKDGSRWLLGRKVDAIRKDLMAELPFWPGLPDTAQDVLVCMAYQLGVSGLLAFKKMLAALGRHDYGAAAKEGLDSDWSAQTPNRARDMMNKLERA